MAQYIKTNQGLIPYEDYLDIMAYQYGYDSYQDLRAEGLIIVISENDIIVLPK